MRLCPSAGSCFFDAGGLDVFAIDGKSFWMVRKWKKDVILYMSTAPIDTLFIILIYCKVLGCRADFKA